MKVVGALSALYLNVYDHICTFVVPSSPLLMEQLKNVPSMFHQKQEVVKLKIPASS